MADPEPDAVRIARQVTEGVRALREGRAAQAVALLAVCMDPAWAAASDLADLRCRAMSLSAQALWQSGRLGEARARADAALALARELGDQEGVQEITALRDEMTAPAPAATAPLRWATGPEADLQGATAALEAGELERAEGLARSAIAAAGEEDVRVAVLARLILARASSAERRALLDEAAELARDAENPTLLGTVARSAGLLGEDLATIRGPDIVAEGGRR